jgi:hypothetical protein
MKIIFCFFSFFKKSLEFLAIVKAKENFGVLDFD